MYPFTYHSSSVIALRDHTYVFASDGSRGTFDDRISPSVPAPLYEALYSSHYEYNMLILLILIVSVYINIITTINITYDTSSYSRLQEKWTKDR